ncbi:hypothetical protein VTK73DRAFT_4006 [Phialemonium thermophilum]|uniref:Uncharacterized protein n=1 Tax=Phialemonium thermophilum TaxID=223376 RepID=A0ABR3VCH7_9PEZI
MKPPMLATRPRKQAMKVTFCSATAVAPVDFRRGRGAFSGGDGARRREKSIVIRKRVPDRTGERLLGGPTTPSEGGIQGGKKGFGQWPRWERELRTEWQAAGNHFQKNKKKKEGWRMVRATAHKPRAVSQKSTLRMWITAALEIQDVRGTVYFGLCTSSRPRYRWWPTWKARGRSDGVFRRYRGTLLTSTV